MPVKKAMQEMQKDVTQFNSPPRWKLKPADVAALQRVTLLCIIIAASIGLYYFHQTYLSLWTDETFSIYYPKMGMVYLWTDGLRMESSPPLYYMVLAGWMHLFGTGEAAVRSLSAAAATLAIPFVYALGCEILDRPRALIAASLFGLSPTVVYYAQEARPYALLFAPIAIALLACARYLRQDKNISNTIIYSVSGLVAIYTYATMVFFIAACGLAVLAAHALVQTVDRRRSMIIWLATNAIIALLALPELAGMLAHVEADRLAWIPPRQISYAWILLSSVITGPLNAYASECQILSAILLGVMAVGLCLRPPNDRMTIVAIGVPALYLAGVLIGSLFQPIIIDRIFCWMLVPFTLLLAHVVCIKSPLRPLVVVMALPIVFTGLVHQLDVPKNAKEPWRGMVHEIEPVLTRADLVILGPSSDPSSLMYYAPDTKSVRMWTEGFPATSDDTAIPSLFGITKITHQDMVEHIKTGDQIVLILRSADASFLRSILSAVPPPQQQWDWTCLGSPCLKVLSWVRNGPDK